MASPPRIELGAATDVGRVRQTNEDSLLAAAPDPSEAQPTVDEVVLAVADGMGGHQAGEIASALAVETLAESLQATAVGTPPQPPDKRLRQAMHWANRSVWEAASRESSREGMGTTLVCALVRPSGEVVIGNVGDSRAYLVTGGKAQLLTTDHSWVIEQVKAGRMSERDAEISPYRHVLSRSLGVLPTVEVDVYTDVRLQPGDALMLCSDGVSTYLGRKDLPRIFEESHTAQEAAERLVRLAIARGGADNATVVVARMLAETAD
jgi:serine/threonine protein phosphatase PrpC